MVVDYAQRPVEPVNFQVTDSFKIHWQLFNLPSAFDAGQGSSCARTGTGRNGAAFSVYRLGVITHAVVSRCVRDTAAALEVGL